MLFIFADFISENVNYFTIIKSDDSKTLAE